MCTSLVTEEFSALETGQLLRRQSGGAAVAAGGVVADFAGLSTDTIES